MEQVNLLRTFFLISAILNLICAVSWGGYAILGGIVFCGLGCLFGAFPVINIIACVLDFIAYKKLNNQNQTGTYSSAQYAAIFDIITILTFNIVSTVFGIIGLVQINNPEFKNYLTQKGIY
jgi:hypothetical protein